MIVEKEKLGELHSPCTISNVCAGQTKKAMFRVVKLNCEKEAAAKALSARIVTPLVREW